jgi:hypothetical protein
VKGGFTDPDIPDPGRDSDFRWRSLVIELTIPLGDSATTRSIAAVTDRLRETPVGATVTVDASDLAEADLSIVQLLEAFRRDSGRVVALAAPANPCLAAVLDRAGFLTAPDADAIDFWFHGELPR